MRYLIFFVVGAVSIFFATACNTSMMVFPDNEWERSTPEEQGIEGC